MWLPEVLVCVFDYFLFTNRGLGMTAQRLLDRIAKGD